MSYVDIFDFCPAMMKTLKLKKGKGGVPPKTPLCFFSYYLFLVDLIRRVLYTRSCF